MKALAIMGVLLGLTLGLSPSACAQQRASPYTPLRERAELQARYDREYRALRVRHQHELDKWLDDNKKRLLPAPAEESRKGRSDRDASDQRGGQGRASREPR